jgi:hypothetical protein
MQIVKRRNARFLVCLTISVMASAVPATAQSVTAFDGTYNGVSNTASGNTHCMAIPVPKPLTIKNGAVSWAVGQMIYQGSVTAQGALTMKADNGVHVYGKIDAAGKITAGSTGSTDCTITSVWQK